MVKSIPSHNFFAESLRESWSTCPYEVLDIAKVAYLANFFEITGRVHSQDLDCDGTALVFAFPNVRVSASVLRDAPSVVANRDL